MEQPGTTSMEPPGTTSMEPAKKKRPVLFLDALGLSGQIQQGLKEEEKELKENPPSQLIEESVSTAETEEEGDDDSLWNNVEQTENNSGSNSRKLLPSLFTCNSVAFERDEDDEEEEEEEEEDEDEEEEVEQKGNPFFCSSLAFDTDSETDSDDEEEDEEEDEKEEEEEFTVFATNKTSKTHLEVTPEENSQGDDGMSLGSMVSRDNDRDDVEEEENDVYSDSDSQTDASSVPSISSISSGSGSEWRSRVGDRSSLVLVAEHVEEGDESSYGDDEDSRYTENSIAVEKLGTNSDAILSNDQEESPIVNDNNASRSSADFRDLVASVIKNETLANETLVNETLVHETLVEETPVEDTLVNKPLVIETDVDETHVIETLVEETLVDESRSQNSGGHTHNSKNETLVDESRSQKTHHSKAEASTDESREGISMASPPILKHQLPSSTKDPLPVVRKKSRFSFRKQDAAAATMKKPKLKKASSRNFLSYRKPTKTTSGVLQDEEDIAPLNKILTERQREVLEEKNAEEEKDEVELVVLLEKIVLETDHRGRLIKKSNLEELVRSIDPSDCRNHVFGVSDGYEMVPPGGH